MTRRIEPIVESILLRHWDGLLPVDVESIARARGCRLLPRKGLDVSGEVCRRDQGWEIVYNADDHEVRQRFTIAHELGHVELGHLADREKCLRDPREHYSLECFDPRERDANRFAASLLMPARAVRAAVANMQDPDIEKLAELFRVSRLAMGIRLKQLGILPAWVPI
jgi:Zn-dependent peptidase ImmA (M78 family)